jgi:hypothetical protein
MEPENSNFTHTHYSVNPSGVVITSNPEPTQAVGDIDQNINIPEETPEP